GSDSTFHFDQAAGGKFVESSEDDEVLWGVISFVKKPEKLIVYGPLGMQGMAVASSYTYEFEATEEGTMVKLIHNAFGDFPEEMGPGHEGGWKELWESLRAYVEQGKTWQELQKT
ncbi:MAG: SRPBCC domain-containing protein, partial [Chlorobiales bacterium]|nr:SRPBCC domain-containing protein [Chlorobiales bacterium]